LGLLNFVSLVVLVALAIVRLTDIPKAIARTDVTQLLEETKVNETIVEAIGETELSNNLDMEGLREFMQRSNVEGEVSKAAEQYLTAIATGNLDYYMSSEDIVEMVKAVAPDIIEEFAYELTDENYDSLAEYLTTSVELEDFRMEKILDNAGVTIALPQVLLSVYPLLAAVFLFLLLVLAIFLLHRKQVRKAFSTIGIVLASAGFVYLLASLFLGVFSRSFISNEIINSVIAGAGVVGRLLLFGLICFGAGVLAITAAILLKKKQFQVQG
jgi:hypothetical protein